MPDSGRFHIIGDMSGAWTALFLISGFINVLALAGAVYMLQVYDRVLTSHSIETLVALSLLVAGVYAVLAALDALRAQMLLRIGDRVDARLMPLAHRHLVAAAPGRAAADALESIHDVDTVRGFHSGVAPVALLDLPWAPIFLLFVWALSPVLGMATLACLSLLLGLAALSQALARVPAQDARTAFSERQLEIEAASRAAEAVSAMGMHEQVQRRFLATNERYLDAYRSAGDVAAVISGCSKLVRLLLQAGIIGLGAWLTIAGEMTAGAIMAASIAAARAVAPVEQAIVAWKALGAMRASHRRLRAVRSGQFATVRLTLPDPRRSLSVEKIAVAAPGSNRIIMRNVGFEAASGSVVAVVGPSGSGKTTLARALTGAWPLAHGLVALDGAPLQRWPQAELGRHIGYLPQSVELFRGSITENIARLEESSDPALVVEAARMAGIHEMVLALPEGYETVLAGDGAPLSAGQRQQIGLARALYGHPFLVVLDEPNASLDAVGEEALRQAILAIKRRGGVVVVMAHRRSLLSVVDLVAVLDAGQLRSFGPPDKVLPAHVTPIRKADGAKGQAARHLSPQSEGALT